MTNDNSSRFLVRAVHRPSSRPWVFVSGELEGAPLHIGSTVQITDETGNRVPASVRTIEIHSAPGLVTFALDAEFAERVTVGMLILAEPAD